MIFEKIVLKYSYISTTQALMPAFFVFNEALAVLLVQDLKIIQTVIIYLTLTS